MTGLAQNAIDAVQLNRLQLACQTGDEQACTILRNMEAQQTAPQGGLGAMRPPQPAQQPQQEKPGKLDWLFKSLGLMDDEQSYQDATNSRYENFLNQMYERDRAASLGREKPAFSLGDPPVLRR